MNELKKRYNAVVILCAKNANVNGDPLTSDNSPRVNSAGYGIITPMCIKRKIRNRWMDMGESVYIQPDDRVLDGYGCLKDRIMSDPDFLEAISNKQIREAGLAAAKRYIDIRAFGSLFAFKNESAADSDGKSKSIPGFSGGVHGPVTVQMAESVLPVEINTLQITKSVNSEGKAGKGSDTMGMLSVVDFGVYPICVSVNKELADWWGFTDNDADLLKKALLTLLDGDASAARPAGSVWIEKLYWFEHETDYSDRKVLSSVKVIPKENPVHNYRDIDDYDFEVRKLDGLNPEIYEDL